MKTRNKASYTKQINKEIKALAHFEALLPTFKNQENILRTKSIIEQHKINIEVLTAERNNGIS
jgi:hypothetical protein